MCTNGRIQEITNQIKLLEEERLRLIRKSTLCHTCGHLYDKDELLQMHPMCYKEEYLKVRCTKCGYPILFRL